MANRCLNKRVFQIREYSFVFFIFFNVFFILINSNGKVEASQSVIPASEIIRLHLSDSPPFSYLEGSGELISSRVMLDQFYKKREYQPAWDVSSGLTHQTTDLIQMIQEATLEGLSADFYHLDRIEILLNKLQSDSFINKHDKNQLIVELDFLLTDAFLLLSCHFSSGCANPILSEVEWFTRTKRVDVVSLLEKSLFEDNVKQSLRSLKPSQQLYLKLIEALFEHRTIVAKGGWGKISNGPMLAKGDTNERVNQLKLRLIHSGDLLVYNENSENSFDDATHLAVIRFQKRHGLQDDGIVGPATLAALNVSAAKRVRQIELNLERFRWSFRDMGERFLMVNIADFKLDAVENDNTVWSMKVVTGKPFWDTPVFSSTMKYLVFNPSWNVPESISIDEILPKINRNPDYLKRNNFSVIRGWGKNEEIVDPSTINWSRLKKENFPYRFRQSPGPLNPLGRIKFMFPNKFNVYLHDSPYKKLFEKNIRMFSHGCIRVEDPVKLATYLMQSDKKWSQEKILKIINEGKETEISLPQPINVHILYLTAWIDQNNYVQFRNDIYGRDIKLEQALHKKIVVTSLSMN